MGIKAKLVEWMQKRSLLFMSALFWFIVAVGGFIFATLIGLKEYAKVHLAIGMTLITLFLCMYFMTKIERLYDQKKTSRISTVILYIVLILGMPALFIFEGIPTLAKLSINPNTYEYDMLCKSEYGGGFEYDPQASINYDYCEGLIVSEDGSFKEMKYPIPKEDVEGSSVK